METSLLASRAAWWLIAIIVVFAAFGLLSCFYLGRWDGDGEWSYLTLGDLALRGRIGPFQDEMGGEQLPFPVYLIGLLQLVAGPSLLAARVTSLVCGGGALVFTFLVSRAIAGPAAGLIAAAFLATHGGLVGYYAAASYFGWCAALVAAGAAAYAGLRRPFGSLACIACLTVLAFSRANPDREAAAGEDRGAARAGDAH